MGTPKHPDFNGLFPIFAYKPSIVGYPHGYGNLQVACCSGRPEYAKETCRKCHGPASQMATFMGNHMERYGNHMEICWDIWESCGNHVEIIWKYEDSVELGFFLILLSEKDTSWHLASSKYVFVVVAIREYTWFSYDLAYYPLHFLRVCLKMRDLHPNHGNLTCG